MLGSYLYTPMSREISRNHPKNVSWLELRFQRRHSGDVRFYFGMYNFFLNRKKIKRNKGTVHAAMWQPLIDTVKSKDCE